jgi:hypothetical protein
MKSYSGDTPAHVVNKSGSTQPHSGGAAPKTGGTGHIPGVVGSPTPIVRPGGVTNNGGGSRGARSGNK